MAELAFSELVIACSVTCGLPYYKRRYAEQLDRYASLQADNREFSSYLCYYCALDPGLPYKLFRRIWSTVLLLVLRPIVSDTN